MTLLPCTRVGAYNRGERDLIRIVAPSASLYRLQIPDTVRKIPAVNVSSKGAALQGLKSRPKELRRTTLLVSAKAGPDAASKRRANGRQSNSVRPPHPRIPRTASAENPRMDAQFAEGCYHPALEGRNTGKP